MKNKYIFLSIFVMFVFSSCESIYDYDDDGTLTYNDIFDSYGLTKNYTGLCYSNLPGYSRSSAGNNFLAVFTDEAQDANDYLNSNAMKYYNGQMLSSNNLLNGSLYSNFYKGIRNCNTLIENIDKVTYFNIEKYRDKWKAEAYILRAYYKWELIKHYGPLPMINETLPIDFDYSNIKRPSFYECVKSIQDDIKSGLDLPGLDWRAVNSDEGGIMTKAVAYAILSQSMLFAASPLWNDGANHWEEAAETTKLALDELVENGYDIYTPSEQNYVIKGCYSPYQDYFLTGVELVEKPRNNEGIYVSKARLSLWQAFGLPLNISLGVTSCGLCPSQELVDSYETIDGVPILDLSKPYLDSDHLQPNYNPAALVSNGGKYDPSKPYENRDPRLHSTIICNGDFFNQEKKLSQVETFVGGNSGVQRGDKMYSNTGYYLRKFINWNSNKNSSLDGFWSFYRMAEMYLNYAEAEFEAHGLSQKVLDAVNKVRKRAGITKDLLLSDFSSNEEFRLRLRNERRVEFAFEELRYFDLRRWKIAKDNEGIVTGMNIEKQNDGSFVYNRFVVQKRDVIDDKYLIWPIPQSEEFKFANLGIKMQNPGW